MIYPIIRYILIANGNAYPWFYCPDLGKHFDDHKHGESWTVLYEELEAKKPPCLFWERLVKDGSFTALNWAYETESFKKFFKDEGRAFIYRELTFERF